MPAKEVVEFLRDGVLGSFVIPAKLVPAKAGSREPGSRAGTSALLVPTGARPRLSPG
jgi:hypothetical protein